MRPTQINWTFRFFSFCLLISLSSALIVPRSRAQEQTEPAPQAKPAVTGRSKPSRRSTSRTGTKARNAQILKIVSEIDARHIENTIRKLVSFGTRNTLSEQNNPNRGIGAARDWLYGEFVKAAQQSGGRMTVEKQTFEQP
jgi:hypothetical protein